MKKNKKFYKILIICFVGIIHYGCNNQDFEIIGLWINQNKDTYNFENDGKLIKSINSTNNINIYGNWLFEKKMTNINDTITIRLEYHTLESDDFTKKINNSKKLKIRILSYEEITLLNENNTKFKKIFSK